MDISLNSGDTNVSRYVTVLGVHEEWADTDGKHPPERRFGLHIDHHTIGFSYAKIVDSLVNKCPKRLFAGVT